MRLLVVLDILGTVESEAGDLAVVLDTDNQLSTRGVREGHDVPCRIVRLDACALAVEVLILLGFGEDGGVVLANRMLHSTS